jgi:hypothetical protein
MAHSRRGDDIHVVCIGIGVAVLLVVHTGIGARGEEKGDGSRTRLDARDAGGVGF